MLSWYELPQIFPVAARDYANILFASFGNNRFGATGNSKCRPCRDHFLLRSQVRSVQVFESSIIRYLLVRENTLMKPFKCETIYIWRYAYICNRWDRRNALTSLYLLNRILLALPHDQAVTFRGALSRYGAM
jgi:hypothetical protein